MSYTVLWKEEARDNLSDLQKDIASAIKNKITRYLVLEPKKNGKPLKRELKGLWCAKYARYRIIYEILELEKTIIIIEIGLRKTIYD